MAYTFQTLPVEERKPLEFERMEDDNKRVAKTKEREFGGAIGALFMTLSLPITVYLLNYMCSEVMSIQHKTTNFILRHIL